MIVAATTPVTPMNTPQDTLDRMHQALGACERGELPIAQLSAQWRSAMGTLPLPPRYGEVLGDLLDRIEAGALFSEESCSFSQKDLLSGLQQWAAKAAQALKS
jgi:hypothetical protein